jgi:hypothetical protein
MRRIERTLIDEPARHFQPDTVASASPYRVETYRRLVEIVAAVSYANISRLLFFRGQGQDFKSKSGASTFYPSIYRGDYLPWTYGAKGYLTPVTISENEKGGLKSSP